MFESNKEIAFARTKYAKVLSKYRSYSVVDILKLVVKVEVALDLASSLLINPCEILCLHNRNQVMDKSCNKAGSIYTKDVSTFDWKDLNGKSVELYCGIDHGYGCDYSVETLMAKYNDKIYILGQKKRKSKLEVVED